MCRTAFSSITFTFTSFIKNIKLKYIYICTVNFIRNNLDTTTMQTTEHTEDNINMDFRQVVKIVDGGPYKSRICFGNVETSGCATTIIVN